MNGHARVLIWGALLTGAVSLVAAFSVAGVTLWGDVQVLRAEQRALRGEMEKARGHLVELWKSQEILRAEVYVLRELTRALEARDKEDHERR